MGGHVGATKLSVSLMSMTPNAEALVYAAFRQCYSAEYAAFIFRDGSTDYLTAHGKEKINNFITKILASGHESPIEHVSFTFAVAGVSRALSHQLVRHRIGCSFSQQSQRYTDSKGFGYIVPPAIDAIPEAKELFEAAMERDAATYEQIQKILCDHGQEKKANEDARFVLPNACETRLVVTMNCRSLLHFFGLRCCQRSQWEARALADEMLKICQEKLPILFVSGGARCEQLGYCPESEKFACGKYPTLSEIQAGH